MKEELLIFMELCSEGTLESLVEMSNGLYEGLTRRYTAQLLDAVSELHKHGVVHRYDITVKQCYVGAKIIYSCENIPFLSYYLITVIG